MIRRIIFSSFSLVLLFLFQFFIGPTSAFTTSLPTSSAQCGSFTITWSADSSQSIGPPFNISVVPVNSPEAPNAYSAGLGASGLSVPILVQVPANAFDAATKTGSYTIEKLPLRTGERFVVVMDDGFGLGTGGVSTVQTVSTPSSDSSCFSSSTNSDSAFSISTLTPSPCQPVSLTTGPLERIRGFVPGGSALTLDHITTNVGSNNVRTEWTMNIPSGTSFVLLYESLDGATLRTSGLITSGSDGSFGNACLTNAPHSTVTASNTQATIAGTNSGNTGNDDGHKKTNVAAIVGGILGGLAFIAIVTLSIFFCVYRRTDTLGRSRSLSTVTPYRSGNSRATGTSGSADDKSKRSGNKEGNNGSGSEGLEGRFGNTLFGGGKRKKGKKDDEWNTGMTSSRKRAMYPGLSFASTQNRSITEDVNEGRTAANRTTEDGRRQRAGDEANSPPPVPILLGSGANRGADGDPTAPSNRWQDSKRRDGRADQNSTGATESPRRGSGTQSSFVSGLTSTGIPRGLDQQTFGGGLTDIMESDARYQSTSASLLSRPMSLHESRSTLLTADGNSATLATPTAVDSKERSSTRKDSNSRPSTAPLSRDHGGGSSSPSGGGVTSSRSLSSRGYHLPTRTMNPGSTDVEQDSSTTHVYPPDRKEPMPAIRNLREEESVDDWKSDGSHHPYALALSPHEDIPGPFSNRGNDGSGGGPRAGRDRGPSISHPYSDPVNTTSGSYQSLGSHHSDTQRQQQRGPGARNGGNGGVQPHIIRHRDAGLMMGSEDGDGQEERMILELPPSYGEIAPGGRRFR